MWMRSWLGHPVERIVVNILTPIKVKLLKEEWVCVLTDDFHGLPVHMLAIAQAQDAQLRGALYHRLKLVM